VPSFESASRLRGLGSKDGGRNEATAAFNSEQAEPKNKGKQLSSTQEPKSSRPKQKIKQKGEGSKSRKKYLVGAGDPATCQLIQGKSIQEDPLHKASRHTAQEFNKDNLDYTLGDDSPVNQSTVLDADGPTNIRIDR